MSNNITITGELGSGKSSVTAILKERLNFEVVSVGFIQRQLATKHNFSATEFNKYMETHPGIDEECDAMVAELGKQAGSRIFDSRMAWHFVPASFKIYLTVDEYIAAERIFKDKGRIGEAFATVEEARLNISERRKSELLRFKKAYGVQINDHSNYDLVIDTKYSTPPEVADCILNNYWLYLGGRPYPKAWLGGWSTGGFRSIH